MAEFIQGTKPKGVFTKKAINIDQNIMSVLSTCLSLCELGTFIMNFKDDLGRSLNSFFFFNGDARLGSGMLKYEIFRKAKVKARVYNFQKKCVIK
jgi:hypothetical protein